jgi:hypothetical protein
MRITNISIFYPFSSCNSKSNVVSFWSGSLRLININIYIYIYVFPSAKLMANRNKYLHYVIIERHRPIFFNEGATFINCRFAHYPVVLIKLMEI